MRQTNITPGINLWPGDKFELTHNIKLDNDYKRVTLIGIRWELVFAEDISAEDAKIIEDMAVAYAS
jgi:hypothetical protein